MECTLRRYQHDRDALAVGQFLERTYPATDRNPNLLRSRWEYAICGASDPLEESLAATGVWEAGKKIVGVVNAEGSLGEAYFQVHPACTHLKAEMLDYAEKSLPEAHLGKRRLTLYLNDFDSQMEELAAAAGYSKAVTSPNVTARLALADDLPDISLPEGFMLTDRQEDNDLRKINKALWRGFDHKGPPPEKHIAGRADVERVPLFRKDLAIMVEAPGGDLVSYCGIWHEAATRVAYVEPVATDPHYRRMGLGTAAMMEGIRRVKKLGATRAIVISGHPFYQAMDFRAIFAYYPWRKKW